LLSALPVSSILSIERSERRAKRAAESAVEAHQRGRHCGEASVARHSRSWHGAILSDWTNLKPSLIRCRNAKATADNADVADNSEADNSKANEQDETKITKAAELTFPSQSATLGQSPTAELRSNSSFGGKCGGRRLAKILVAASPEPRAVVERVLAGHELSCAETMAEGEQLLRERTFDLIICTIVFDESKMFDFLRLAKSRLEWQRIPFVGARVRAQVLHSPTALKAAALTCQTLGAEAFLNIADYQVDPEREMRDAIERVLNSGGTSG
jgi:CheY-like chemotaxis protein